MNNNFSIKKDKKNKIHRKSIKTWVLLFLVNGLILVAGFTIFLRMSVSAKEKTAVAQTEQNMRVFSHSLADLLEDKINNFCDKPDNKNISGEKLKSIYSDFANTACLNKSDFRITIIAEDGSVIVDSFADASKLENHGSREEVASAIAGADGVSLHKSSVDGRTVMYYATPVSTDSTSAVLRLAVPLERTVFFTANMTRNTVVVGLCILIFTMLCSFFISMQIVKPLNELSLATSQYERGNFAYKVSIKSPSEMAELGDSFTHMAQTIETNIKKMKRLEQVRKDFVANVSHELKTPITSIKGFTETLSDGAVDDPESARRFLKIISQQTDRLTSIIEDLLTLSRLEQDDAVLEKDNADVRNILADVCASFSQQAQNKNIIINFKNEMAENEISFIRPINQGLVCQAVGNVIDNALKYCPEESVVDCYVVPFNGKNKIIIEDNGPGIPEKIRERVFERFFRVDKGRSRDMGGTGLGLSIVKHIVELHGGSVKCLPREDGTHGARFEIII